MKKIYALLTAIVIATVPLQANRLLKLPIMLPKTIIQAFHYDGTFFRPQSIEALSNLLGKPPHRYLSIDNIISRHIESTHVAINNKRVITICIESSAGESENIQFFPDTFHASVIHNPFDMRRSCTWLPIERLRCGDYVETIDNFGFGVVTNITIGSLSGSACNLIVQLPNNPASNSVHALGYAMRLGKRGLLVRGKCETQPAQ